MHLRAFAFVASCLLLIKNVQAVFPPRVPHPKGQTWNKIDEYRANMSLDEVSKLVKECADLMSGYEAEMEELESEKNAQAPGYNFEKKEERLVEVMKEFSRLSSMYKYLGKCVEAIKHLGTAVSVQKPKKREKKMLSRKLTFDRIGDSEIDSLSDATISNLAKRLVETNKQFKKKEDESHRELHSSVTICDSSVTTKVLVACAVGLVAVIVIVVAIYVSRSK